MKAFKKNPGKNTKFICLLLIAVLCILCGCNSNMPGESAPPSAVAGGGEPSPVIEPPPSAALEIPQAEKETEPYVSPEPDSAPEPISVSFPVTETPEPSEAPVIELPPPTDDSDDFIDASLELYSTNAIMIRLNDNHIIYELNAQEQTYPASLTKIMTAIVAIENLSELDDTLIITYDMVAGLYEENASVAGFQAEEEVTIRDLLYGVMLPSGADASNAVAIASCGSVDAFVEEMNAYAAALGMTNTHFTNVHGLHDDMHYSTVYDLSLLLEYALLNPTFRDIFCTEQYTTQATNLSEGITMRGTMFNSMTSPDFEGGEILGGKTGYTHNAGQCLASLAVKDGVEYILVTTNARGENPSAKYHVIDAFRAYEAIPYESVAISGD